MRILQLVLCLSIFVFSTCSNESKESMPKTKYPEIFNKVLEAHGGKTGWDAMNTLTYVRGKVDMPEQHTVDLRTRKSVIEVKDKYKLGFNGEDIWVSPDRDSFPGKSPRFMHNLHFYFIAIPFVFTDPGVNIKDSGIVESGGEKYHLLNVTFGEGVGDAPEDHYNMYVNPQNHKVEFITYSVTYFDKSRATQYNALKYEWADANGLLAPAKLIGFKWENETFGEQRYESEVRNAHYDKASKDDSFFAIPKDGEVTTE